MAVNMSKYLGLFVSEGTEHLEALGRELVQLERDPGPGVVDSMFRHAHSVKGMASSMGFEPIARLAHRVEDLVDAVRSDRSLLTRELVDALLAASDTLLNQVRVAGGGGEPDPAAALIADLERRVVAMGRKTEPTRVAQTTLQPLLPNEAAPAVPPVPEAPAGPVAPIVPAPVDIRPDAGLGLPPRWAVRVRVAPTCQAPGVRAFLVQKRLSGLGNLFDLRPPLEDLKAGRIPEGLINCELETSAGEEAVAASLRNVSEVEVVWVKPAPQATVPAPASQPASSPEGGKLVGGEPAARTVRIRTELLDYFLDTVGELLLATARIREVGRQLAPGTAPHLDENVDRLHSLVKDLHDKVMSARMMPISVITDRLPRVARDIARRKGREADLVINGGEIELDRAILDELSDPLLHLLRNCIDHGLESPEERAAAGKSGRGRVLVSVRRERDRVLVDIEDDGRGMDPEKLKHSAVARGFLTQEAASRLSDKEAFLLSCLPGVSTAADISDLSGRGVGMDAVKRSVENVGGSLEIDSERGRGTSFSLRLPLTVAVVSLLLVQVGDQVVGLPVGKVLGAVETHPASLSESQQRPMLPFNSGLVPVYLLADLLSGSDEVGAGFRFPAVPDRFGTRPYVVTESDGGKVALAVDRLLGQEEVVLKTLSKPLDLISGLSGVTILGTGRPVFILDVPRLLAA